MVKVEFSSARNAPFLTRNWLSEETIDLTEQMRAWAGEFGREYTERNACSLEETEDLYRKYYGVSRTELNQRFMKGIERSGSILEVGANIGTQLMFLQKMGFSRLYGIEVQKYAIELSRESTRDIHTVRGTAQKIPFADQSFDLVFTSGLLIHIRPSDIAKVMKEIHRCTRKYVWGLEHYADHPIETPYRGRKNLLWKMDYADLFLELFDDLELLKEERLAYLTKKEMDTMFLLRKKPVEEEPVSSARR
jgi:pseudaminic acid biosynthesis-associated methylase